MAKYQASGPTDVAAVVIDGSQLVLVDGRGQPWVFEGGKTDAAGNEIPGPTSADVGFVMNERAHVIAGGVCWTYYPGPIGWVEGFDVDIKAEDTEDPLAETSAWLRGRSVETRAAIPDELRRAEATIAAAEAAAEAEGGSGSKKSKKKTKAHEDA